MNRPPDRAVNRKRLAHLKLMATAVRALSLDMVYAAGSGHVGMPLGMADVATVLFAEFLRFDPRSPAWPGRDRVVLSNGHGSALLYSILHLLEVPGMTRDELRGFRRLGSRTPGHPELNPLTGVEITTGALGQGLANAVGFALAQRRLQHEYGTEVFDQRTYAFAGDGCLMEGVGQEAIALAARLALDQLIVLFDDNRVTLDGPTDCTRLMGVAEQCQAAGWNVLEVNGHCMSEVRRALGLAVRMRGRPTLIACRTTIGLGLGSLEGTAAAHACVLSREVYQCARRRISWKSASFRVPREIRELWREVRMRGREVRKGWQMSLRCLPSAQRRELIRRFTGDVRGDARSEMTRIERNYSVAKQRVSPQEANEEVLTSLSAVLPGFIVGSADVGTSTGVRPRGPARKVVCGIEGNYVHFGAREHAMAAIANGLAVHGGFTPCVGMYLAFTDYARPALRMAALMRAQSIFVCTHDSIAVGANGPTHQPIEQLAALRAIPNLLVMRPSDGRETVEAWKFLLTDRKRPAVLVLGRGLTPVMPVRRRRRSQERYAGAHVVWEPAGPRDATLIGTGSEVSLAIEASRVLERIGVAAAVVSLWCWELFMDQPAAFRMMVLGRTGVRVAIEAGVFLGWDKFISDDGGFVGLTSFGASGAPFELRERYELTSERVVAEVLRRLRRRSRVSRRCDLR